MATPASRKMMTKKCKKKGNVKRPFMQGYRGKVALKKAAKTKKAARATIRTAATAVRAAAVAEFAKL